ncbi:MULTISPECIES: hypothetical protein [Trichocoleus]|uniref:Uncharacterized protein n=1 Tax=Trichocoleus desertorum GB2-A4 TaxID=2933944 RepID=A0ABV0JB97_9CYAN|nr:hypothetical protein [Trichocoleus sp. FACHB-46]MBD1864750.1 hypothetical protein [Trichocoleus sp. FACHB-46]
MSQPESPKRVLYVRRSPSIVCKDYAMGRILLWMSQLEADLIDLFNHITLSATPPDTVIFLFVLKPL